MQATLSVLLTISISMIERRKCSNRAMNLTAALLMICVVYLVKFDRTTTRTTITTTTIIIIMMIITEVDDRRIEMCAVSDSFKNE
jgi:hypothetical protein